MKAITLWQPWASFVALDLKRYETRSWSTKHRGALAIHAGLKVVSLKKTAPTFHRYLLRTSLEYRDLLTGSRPAPKGMVIAIVDLTDVILMDEAFIESQSILERHVGDWAVGRYAWRLENLHVLPEPIPAIGHQRLWEWLG